MHVYLRFRSFNLNFRYMALRTQTDIHMRLAMLSRQCGARSGSPQLTIYKGCGHAITTSFFNFRVLLLQGGTKVVKDRSYVHSVK